MIMFSWSVNTLKALSEDRLEDGELKKAVVRWIDKLQDLIDERNSYVHSRWMLHAGTIKEQVSKGKFKIIKRNVRPKQLFSLAERMWEAHQEGTHLVLDLARAGFVGTTEVSSKKQVVNHHPPSNDYRLKDVTPLENPHIAGNWPGRAYYPVSE
jgi:hypothetical protein